MQIRLTVLGSGSRSGHQTATATASGGSTGGGGMPTSCDVLVTAPAGTALSAVASGLAATVGGPDTGGTVVLYAGTERLDPSRCALGEPPLVDGAVLSLNVPGPDVRTDAAGAGIGDGPQLHVVAGPDAGGVHLLHPGAIRIGRSADADVPLDDPDVSRLHCTVTVLPDGRVAVADLGSTNGTTLDGTAVGAQRVALAPGALLRVGESTLRLAVGPAPAPLSLTPDLEGHLCVPLAGAHPGAEPEPSGAYPGEARTGATPAGGAGAHPAGGEARTDPTPAAGAYAEAGARTGPAPRTAAGAYAEPGGHGGHGGHGGAWADPAPAAATGAYAEARGHGAVPAGTVPAARPGAGRGPRGGHAADAPGSVPGARPGEHPGGAWTGSVPGAPSGAYPDAGGRAPQGRFPHPSPSPDGGSAPGTGTGPASGSPEAHWNGNAGPAPAARGAEQYTGGGWSTPASASSDDWPYPGPDRDGTAGPARAGRIARPGSGAPGAGYRSAPDPAVPDRAAAGSGAAESGAAGFEASAPGHEQYGGPGRAASGARPHGGSAPGARAAGQYGDAGPGAQHRTGVEHHGEGGWGEPTAEPAPDRSTAPESESRRGSRRGIGAWARKWVRGPEAAEVEVVAETAPAVVARPGSDDPAALLLTALGPAPRLWAGPAGLDVTLGAGSEVALRETGALGIAGPRARLTGVARSVIARLAALHAPGQRLEIVLICADRARPLAERRRDWGWLGWLPHVRPAHGQDCRLLLAYDRDQAAARAGELTRRLDDGPLGTHWAAAGPEAVREASYGYRGPYTLLVLDGDPGPGALRDITSRLASHGPAAGIHVLALAEAPAATPASPVAETYEAACAATPAFRDCRAAALLSGDVATTVRTFAVSGGRPAAAGGTATADAVSAAWAERFARALAPLKPDSPATEGGYRPAAASLPQTSRLLDELGLARATPASLMARWAAATDQGQHVGGLAEIVLGNGRRGPVGAELVTDGPHMLIEGPAGSGRTELLRSVAASLSAAARPDRLGLVLLDGAGGERGDGLLPCTELPHVSAHLVASDPLRMREFAQALGAELKRRAEFLDGAAFSEWHALHEVSDRMVSPRQPTPGELRGDLEPQRSGTLRLRSSATRTDPAAGPSPLPRLVVLVDDFDALVAPGLGSTGRPAAGSVVRALEAVAREGARLGVHLVATSARPERTADTELARLTTLRVELDAPDQPGPGRGVLRYADGRTAAFQGGRVTGRIPRTATLRPTVIPVEWERMGDPPARRPVRELGNGPTDLALLASALDRASHLVSAVPVLFPPAP
ncbi:FHA domain-containing protein [Streptomyces sp. H34-S4]|uniref:FHA domain-containing protein n=1 Tax=Streptomyces sp. H34-S4 TaxID=2996463 RepID=UPI003B639BFD